MDTFPCEYPKLLISDLKQCRKKEDSSTWLLDVNFNINKSAIKKTLEFLTVQIQGIIAQKPCDEIMIIKDSTGKVKLTNCDKVLGPKTSINEGMYCAVTGILVREKGLPEISGIKLIHLGESNEERSYLYEYWPVEVEDYKLFVADVISPELNTEDISN